MFIPSNKRICHAEGMFPFEMGYLPPQFQRKAEIELRESPENIEKSMRLMRELVTKDKNFRGLVIEDDIFLQYLRGRKFDVHRAFSHLKAFVNLRKNIKAFNKFRSESVSEAANQKILTFLPWRCPDGCAILLVELDNWYPNEFSIEDVKRLVLVVLTQALRDPMTQVNGFKVIFDVKSNPMRHLRYCTPSNLYLMYHATQECIGGRFKGIHIVNQSLALKAGWMLVKPFLTEKLKKRIVFHSGPETLLNFFPTSVLPVEYGGDLKQYDMIDWFKKAVRPESLAKICGEPVPTQGST